MKIAILGTENSHANAFLDLINNDSDFSDVELIGIYGYDDNANKKLCDEGFSGIIAKDPHEFLGKVDAIMTTARHGDHHYEYALPYVKAGIPSFIDKPFCVDLKKGEDLIKEAKANGTLLSGGSSIRFLSEWEGFAEYIKNNEIVGGTVSAPINMENEYGGYYFYSQHLIEEMLEVFGCDVKAVTAYCPDKTKNRISVIFDYGDYDVTALYYKSYAYSITAYTTEGGVKCEFTYNGGGAYKKELNEFCEMVKSGKMPHSYERLLLPLRLLHAVEKSFTEKRTVALSEI